MLEELWGGLDSRAGGVATSPRFFDLPRETGEGESYRTVQGSWSCSCIRRELPYVVSGNPHSFRVLPTRSPIACSTCGRVGRADLCTQDLDWRSRETLMVRMPLMMLELSRLAAQMYAGHQKRDHARCISTVITPEASTLSNRNSSR